MWGKKKTDTEAQKWCQHSVELGVRPKPLTSVNPDEFRQAIQKAQANYIADERPDLRPGMKIDVPADAGQESINAKVWKGKGRTYPPELEGIPLSHDPIKNREEAFQKMEALGYGDTQK